jgi:RNA polymerase sigma factor (sigma-70 family)
MSSPDPDGALALDLPIQSDGAAIAEGDDVRAEVLALFDECAPRLRRYARSCGLTPQAADDVVQDTFVQLYRHLCLGRSRSNLHGWLFTVCHRLARKRRARIAQQFGRESSLDSDRADAMFDAVLDPGDDPEQQLARLDRGRRLRAAIRALPERHRQCLGISLGAVAKALAHVVFRLSHVKE